MLLALPFALFGIVVIAVLVGPVFTVVSLVEVSRTPEPAFGPPWDNGKNAWTLGLALAFVIPFGVFVGPILWWTQGHAALRQGQQVPRPFWSPRPSYPYPYPYPQQPPPPPPEQP